MHIGYRFASAECRLNNLFFFFIRMRSQITSRIADYVEQDLILKLLHAIDHIIVHHRIILIHQFKSIFPWDENQKIKFATELTV